MTAGAAPLDHDELLAAGNIARAVVAVLGRWRFLSGVRRPRLDPARPKVPDVAARFLAYEKMVGAEWGPLHIVLADNNLEDASVLWCWANAKAKGDEEGAALAAILFGMSKTQRERISALPLPDAC